MPPEHEIKREPEPQNDEDRRSSRKGKFRFKSSSRHPESSKHDHSRQHRKRSHGSREDGESSKRRHRDPHRHRPAEPTQLPAADAFRESLFDALGDDEGAAYWESVYGQPIHNYSVPHVQGPQGELEQMTEEEYVAYVRTRMWERTREAQIEEQERLRAERKKKRSEEQGRAAAEERRAFERAMDDSLRRGAERKKGKAWGEVWEKYLKRWQKMEAERLKNSDPPRRLREMIFWPVSSGRRGDVDPAAVKEFMKHAPDGDFLNTLKTERIRWHPDKIQHRYGALGVDEVVMRSVTEVFQIIDRMWSEKRDR